MGMDLGDGGYTPSCSLVWQEPAIYVGSLEEATKDSMRADVLGISHILSMGAKLEGGCTSTLSVMHIDVLDVSSTDLLGHLPPALSFLSSCNAGAIVHCLHGQSRSVAVVMAFLMVRKGLTLDAAYRHVSSRRPSACLNPGFIRQLALLEGLISRGAREESDRAFAEYRLFVAAKALEQEEVRCSSEGAKGQGEAGAGLEEVSRLVEAGESAMREMLARQEEEEAAAVGDSDAAPHPCNGEPSSAAASSTSRPVLPQTGGHASTTPPSCLACRRCRTRLCALDASTMVRHGWDDTSALAESLISLLQDASPGACSFYGYAHELRRHSLLHCTPCSDGYKAAARSKLATASAGRGTPRPCPHQYLSPPAPLLAALLQPDGAIKCPKPRCGVRVGTWSHAAADDPSAPACDGCGGPRPRLAISLHASATDVIR